MSTFARGVCESCGRGVALGPVTGPPRRFCGEDCRQDAHRRRLRAAFTPKAAASAVPRPAPGGGGPFMRRPVPPVPSAEAVTDLARRVREQAHDLVRRLPTADDEEALRRVAQLREQLDGLTAAVVGRACRDSGGSGRAGE
ncbi:hypothetical protein [Streptomyces sp. EN23]|uniref:hypothetical protein n=1 Tax=Streptomyces sp. EN23 TaxID=212774 RepID=UPI000851B804|nr:hypothetical protein [Streptomyces sp. EN23]